MELYLRTCKLQNTKGEYRAVALKPGVSQNAALRDTEAEFEKAVNTIKSANGFGALSPKHKITVDDDFRLKGPDFFIKKLENYIINNVFHKEDLYFSTKTEYFCATPESVKEYSSLLKILEANLNEVLSLNDTFDELNTLIGVKKPIKNLTALVNKQYDLVYNKIVSSLSKEKFTSSDDIPQLPIKKPPTMDTVDIYNPDILFRDFELYSDGIKYMLVHKIYHKNKSNDIFHCNGSFKVDVSSINSSKSTFQFHNTEEIKKYNYPSRAKAIRIVNLFKQANKILKAPEK